MKPRKTRHAGVYRRGWFGDQLRHSLAARGVKVGRKRKLTKDEIEKYMGGHNSFSDAILADLYKARRPLTMKQISERTGISWITVKTEISKLHEERKISPKRKGSRVYWEISTDSVGG